MARKQWLSLTTDWQAVRLPNGDVGRIRQDPWVSRWVQVDDGRMAREFPPLVLPKAALRGYRPYVPVPFPRWCYHSPTMSMQWVETGADQEALGPNWVESPADYGMETHPGVERPWMIVQGWREKTAAWGQSVDLQGSPRWDERVLPQIIFGPLEMPPQVRAAYERCQQEQAAVHRIEHAAVLAQAATDTANAARLPRRTRRGR